MIIKYYNLKFSICVRISNIPNKKKNNKMYRYVCSIFVTYINIKYINKYVYNNSIGIMCVIPRY